MVDRQERAVLLTLNQCSPNHPDSAGSPKIHDRGWRPFSHPETVVQTEVYRTEVQQDDKRSRDLRARDERRTLHQVSLPEAWLLGAAPPEAHGPELYHSYSLCHEYEHH